MISDELQSSPPFMTGPHRSTMYVDAAYCYRPSSVVCWSITVVSPAKTNQDAVWVEDSGGLSEPCIRWGSRSPIERGNFEEGKRRPTVKYRDTLRSSVQKLLNRW